MDDLVAKLKADPGAVSWGGGSAGGTDHILAGLIAKAVGVDPTKVNYIAFSGGGEALAAILGGQVTVGVSGLGEFESQIEAGTLRLLAVSGDERVEGVDAPTLTEAGVDVALENWRMVAAAPGITDEQKAAITADIEKMATSEQWQKALADRGWDDRYLAGDDFTDAARRRHRGDAGDPDGHRPGAMSGPDGAAPARPGGAGHRRPARGARGGDLLADAGDAGDGRYAAGRADDAALRDVAGPGAARGRARRVGLPPRRFPRARPTGCGRCSGSSAGWRRSSCC